MTPLEGLVLIGPTALAGIAVVAYAAYGAMGRRLLLSPILAATAGVVGLCAIAGWFASGAVLSAVSTAGAERVSVALQGIADQEAWVSGTHWGAALVLLMAAWGAALGSLTGATPATRIWTMPSGLAALGLLSAGTLAGAVTAASQSAPRVVYVALGVAWLGGIPLAIASLRRGSGDASARLGAVRLVTATASMLALVQVWRGAHASITATSFASMSQGPADLAVWGAAAEMHGAASSVAWITLLFFGFAGVVSIAEDVRSIFVTSTMVDLAASVGVIAAVGAVRAVQDARLEQVWYAARGGPVAGLFADPTATLPSGVIAGVAGEGLQSAYGDVLVYDGVVWHREARLEDGLWLLDRAPLAADLVVPAADTPLLAARSVSPAGALVSALEVLPERRGWLLARTADNPYGRMEAEPALLGLATAVPIRLAASPVDLDAVVWAGASSKRPYRGALWWYGPGSDDADAVRRVRSALAATGSDTLVVAVGKGDTVKDVVALCGAATMDEAGRLTDRVCALHPMSEEEMLADVRLRWTPPPARARVSTEREDLVAQEVARRVQIEAPALDACTTSPQGDEIGFVKLEIGLSFQGEVGDVRSLAASGLSARSVDCVLARLRVMRFAGAVTDSMRMPIEVRFPDPLAPEEVEVPAEEEVVVPKVKRPAAAVAPAAPPELKVYRSAGKPGASEGG